MVWARALTLVICALPGLAQALTVVDQTGQALSLPATPAASSRWCRV